MGEGMTTILYHARGTGAIARKIAAVSGGKIQAICDKVLPQQKLDGTLVRWDSKAQLDADVTINSAEAVKLSRNKRESRMVLAGLCPETWVRKDLIKYPCVVRPKRHFGGQKFFLCKSLLEVKAAIKRCGGAGRWYAAKFIEKTSEYRVFVFNEKAFKVVRRYRDDGDVTQPWNAHNGGKSARVKKEHWPTTVVRNAETATGKLGLQLAAMDVIVDAAGEAFVLEANTAPGLERQKTINKFAEILS